jgi:hypothetical protein
VKVYGTVVKTVEAVIDVPENIASQDEAHIKDWFISHRHDEIHMDTRNTDSGEPTMDWDSVVEIDTTEITANTIRRDET